MMKVTPLAGFVDLVFVLIRVDLFGDKFAGCQGRSVLDKIADYPDAHQFFFHETFCYRC